MSMFGCIHRNLTIIGNIGVGVDDLHSFTLPAGSLAADGDFLSIDYGGSFASNDNDKRVIALFDGQAYEDGLAAPIDLDGGPNNGWRFLNRIIRVSATSVRVHSLLTAQFLHVNSAGAVIVPGNAGFLLLNRNAALTVANLNNNAIVMKVQGEATSNNDVVQDMSIIEISQQ